MQKSSRNCLTVQRRNRTVESVQSGFILLNPFSLLIFVKGPTDGVCEEKFCNVEKNSEMWRNFGGKNCTFLWGKWYFMWGGKWRQNIYLWGKNDKYQVCPVYNSALICLLFFVLSNELDLQQPYFGKRTVARVYSGCVVEGGWKLRHCSCWRVCWAKPRHWARALHCLASSNTETIFSSYIWN